MRELEGAIEQADWPRALGLALEAWRASRMTALADLIDAIAARCPPVTVPRREQHVWWVQAAATYHPVTVTTLVAMAHDRLNKADGSWDEMRARHPPDDAVIARLLAMQRPAGTTAPLPNHQRNRVERLAAIARWPADPRAAGVLARWFADDPIRWDHPFENIVAAYRDILVEQLERIADARVVPLLADVRDRPRARSAMGRDLEAQLATRAIERIEQRRVPDDPAVVAWVRALAPPEVTAPERDLRDLWREAARDRDADAPRMVLADALLERGDPRGELVRLQLSRDPLDANRAQSLLARHWKDWLGDLTLMFRARTTTFERGTLATATVHYDGVPEWVFTQVGDHRELVVVDTLWPGWKLPETTFAALLGSLAVLPRRTMLTPALLDALLALRPTWDLQSLHVMTPLGDLLQRIVAAMPHLEELTIAMRTWDVAVTGMVPLLPSRLPRLRKVQVKTAGDFRGYTDGERDMILALGRLPFVELTT